MQYCQIYKVGLEKKVTENEGSLNARGAIPTTAFSEINRI